MKSRQDKLRDSKVLLREALARAGTSGEVDHATPQQIFAGLASDWAFVIRFEPDGSWYREWMAGHPAQGDSAAREAGESPGEPWSEYVHAKDRGVVVAFRRGFDIHSDHAVSQMRQQTGFDQ